MIASVGASKDDIEGCTDFARSIEGVEVACMIEEVDFNTFRINFRSSGNYVINDIARDFGGGGHYYAAGARVEGMTVKELEKVIVDKLKNKVN